MYRPATRHPLSSFRFWFLVIGCVAATTVWRLGWLPPSKPTPGPQNGPEVALSPAAQRTLTHRSAASTEPGAESLPVAVAEAQSEPPADMTSPFATTSSATGAAAFPESPAYTGGYDAPGATNGSPFGVANPEFVAANAFARRTGGLPQDGSQPDSADPGTIQQVVAVEAAPEVKAAAIVTGEIPDDFPRQTAAQVDWADIDRLINSGQDVEAHRILSTLYWEQPGLRTKLRDRIRQTAQRIYFQPQPHYADPYAVQSGDLLQNVARQYAVTWQYLAKLNRTDPLQIRPDQRLKVIQGPFGAVVDLRRFELTVHAHGYFVAQFPIGIGKDGTTPVGDFTVQDKLEDPTYYGPDGVIAHDDPRNPLGEFWIALGDGYGIHGTIDETTIGRAESRGCLRLKNQDVADLYDLLTIGSSVVIRR